MLSKFEIKEIEQKDLIYFTAIGVNNASASFEKLVEWTFKNGIMKTFDSKETEFITIYSDFKNSEMRAAVDLNMLKLKACIKIDRKLTEGYDIDTTEIRAGKYVVGKFIISDEPSDFSKSWEELVRWTKENTYVKDNNREPFEIYCSRLNDDNVIKVELYYPIE